MNELKNSYISFLKQLGLSEEQARIYLLLLEQSGLEARKISLKNGISRTLCYKILDDMINLGVIYREDSIGKVAQFFASSPSKLNEIINKQKEQLNILEASFNAISGALNSEWNRTWGRPSISIYEGVEGIQKIYDGILNSNTKQIYVISSPLDKDDEVKEIIRNQIIKQARRGIKTKAITPLHDGFASATRIEEDEKHLIQRKKIDQSTLPIPAQIIISNDTVSITNFKDNINNFILHSPKAAESLRLVFELLWSKL
jgi:sugar-specific transcriptional regulator TrmB